MSDELDPKVSGEVEDTPEETPEENASAPQAESDESSAGPTDPEAEAEAPSQDGESSLDEVEAKAEADMLKMLDDLPQDDSRATADDINFDSTSASRAEFQHLQEPVTPPDARNIELLMDVDLPISIELGRTRMSIADILGLGPGSVVELNKLAGEPVDLLVNHKVVARGEVVVVDENFGLRVTQLMTPEERLRALAEE